MSLTDRAAARVTAFFEQYSPLLIAAVLIAVGLCLYLLGALWVWSVTPVKDPPDPAGLFWAATTRTLGQTILVAGIIGAVFRVVAALNLQDELFRAFVLDPRVLRRRTDLDELWFSLTKQNLFRSSAALPEDFAAATERALKESLMQGEDIVIRNAVRRMAFEWAERSDDTPTSTRIRVTQDFSGEAIPIGPDGKGTYSQVFTPTDEGDLSAYKIEPIYVREGGAMGRDLEKKVTSKAEAAELSVIFDKPTQFTTRTVLEWDIAHDPHFQIALPYLLHGYRLDATCKQDGMALGFVSEVNFMNDLPEEEAESRKVVRQHFDGVLLPGQSHTLSIWATD